MSSLRRLQRAAAQPLRIGYSGPKAAHVDGPKAAHVDGPKAAHVDGPKAAHVDDSPASKPMADVRVPPKKTGFDDPSDFSTQAGDALASSPIYLSGPARRAHIEGAILADHASVMAQNPDGAKAKLEKLMLSPFIFFRGTAGLFYRDVASTDQNLPKVLISGDVHPENFGVLTRPDGKLMFGLTDFDEATMAPFSWDIKRGATGFALAARAREFSPDDETKIVKKFVEGYLDALKGFSENANENSHVFDADNSPKVIRDLLEGAAGADRREFLKERVDLSEGKFLHTDEIEPISARVPDFQSAVDAYVRRQGERKPQHFEVKDVARKTGSGTASVGLERYYVLIEGPSRNKKDDVILELKQENPSVAASYVPRNPLQFQIEAARVVAAKTVQAGDADPYFGYTELDGKSFLVRERSPFKARLDLLAVDEKDMARYAEVCGAALAQAHARSDKGSGFSGAKAKDIEKKILASIGDSFKDDVAGFADEMATRVELDHGMFRSLMADNAFGTSEPLEDEIT